MKIADSHTLDYLLHNTVFWRIGVNNEFIATVTENAFSKEDYLVPESILVLKHPLFPIALRALIACHIEDRADERGAYGYCVDNTLCALTNGLVTFKDWNDTANNFLYIESLQLFVNAQRHISVSGLGVSVDYIDHHGQQVPFVVNSNHRKTMTSSELLEQAYPGWEKRLNVGQDLGIDEFELMRSVFTTPPEEKVIIAMSPIRFD